MKNTKFRNADFEIVYELRMFIPFLLI